MDLEPYGVHVEHRRHSGQTRSHSISLGAVRTADAQDSLTRPKKSYAIDQGGQRRIAIAKLGKTFKETFDGFNLSQVSDGG
jgi:hypothetical protein